MYQDFLQFLHASGQTIFIEAEAKSDRMTRFIEDYNSQYGERVTIDAEGIRCLGEDVDKWGLELRIYFNDIANLSDYWIGKKYRNRNYRADEFDYRLDDNELVQFLFENGYRIGRNLRGE